MSSKKYETDIKAAEDMLEQCPNVFVYGTLKKNYGNNRILSYSRFIGEDTTQEGWVLGTAGYPYAFPPSVVPSEYAYLTGTIRGEVYEVGDLTTCRRLDILEGYPNHYDREIITTKSGMRAWIYTQPDWSYAALLDAATLTKGEWSWP